MEHTAERRTRGAHDVLPRAALLVFIEDGFVGTRREQVAARAGVSKVTLYRRWSSKRVPVVTVGRVVPLNPEPGFWTILACTSGLTCACRVTWSSLSAADGLGPGKRYADKRQVAI